MMLARAANQWTALNALPRFALRAGPNAHTYVYDPVCCATDTFVRARASYRNIAE